MSAANCAPMLTLASKPLEVTRLPGAADDFELSELKPEKRERYTIQAIKTPLPKPMAIYREQKKQLEIQDVTEFNKLSFKTNPDRAGWYIIRACREDGFCITFDLDQANAEKLKAAIEKHGKVER